MFKKPLPYSCKLSLLCSGFFFFVFIEYVMGLILENTEHANPGSGSGFPAP